MSIISIGVILALLLFLSLASGLWVSFTLLMLGMVGLIMQGTDWGMISSTTVWGGLSVWSLTSLPMFLWMGEILFRTKLSKNLYDGLSIWFQRVPGKLFHVNIFGCGLFAAVSGSSAATVATIGSISMKNMERLNYDKRLTIGTLGGAGTLGLLIPPSIVLIIYGVSADVSIARLFMGGVLPGIMLMLFFSIYVILFCFIFPNAAPAGNDISKSFTEKIKASLPLFPVLILIIGVIGSIYAGVATPNEAAAIGVLGSLLLAKLDGSLTKKIFIDGLFGAVKTNSMLLFIIAGANTLSIAMAYIGIPRELSLAIGALNLDKYSLLFMLGLLFVFLGCFLDGISIILLTTAVILPLIKSVGIDPLWFGIYLVLLVEMAQISPPVGFNLFILQSLTGENVFKVALYTAPFFFLIVLAVIVITAFPEIVTFLPQAMTGH